MTIGQYSGIGMQPRQELFLRWKTYLLAKYPKETYTDIVQMARANAAEKMEVPND